jgi:biopolymer transport protein TolR
MAVSGIGTGSGSGRRRSLDAEVNLVPFIDLLSMCICFLLMTAVWTQLGAVQVKQANGSEAAETSPKETVDVDGKFISSTEFAISVKKAGKVMKTFSVTGATEALLSANAAAQLATLKGSLAAEGLKVTAVMLTPSQDAPYGLLVAMMDSFRRNEMVNIGVVPVKPAAGDSHASR